LSVARSGSERNRSKLLTPRDKWRCELAKDLREKSTRQPESGAAMAKNYAKNPINNVNHKWIFPAGEGPLFDRILRVGSRSTWENTIDAVVNKWHCEYWIKIYMENIQSAHSKYDSILRPNSFQP